MRHSDSMAAIAKALAASQKEYKSVPKTKEARVLTKKGGEYSYKYADLADVLTMAIPILSAHGICFLQPNERIDGKLYVTTLLLHESGEWMQSDGIEVDEMEWQWNEFEKKRILERADPRTVGGDFTYYRRYDGCSFIGIAPDEDVDGKNNGPLPSNRGKNQTEATESRQSVAEVRASAEKRAAEMAKPEGTWEELPDGVRCIVKSATKKETAGANPRPYLAVTWNGRCHGFNYATTFDTALFDTIMGAVNKEMQFKLKPWKDGDKFLNITEIVVPDDIRF